ncbi:chromatin complexes subunit BAP18-like [Vanessa tameamea]|uniref:Chromatin complexes subunit BAP18-like n=1 Tax=Vanessa tameamea TaxID=334116 RepID=A0A8B8HT42_VANTA|nr:chromatin complexes subunit BAP18-like [Vanessa tameamea]XP_047544782.1 chromatin complexes subunit BAP18-like [Vanessa atalanta]
MNNSAAKVGEIFTEAGAAFNKLAEMTMMLHPMTEQQSSTQSKTPVKRKIQDERLGVSNTGSGQVTLNMLNAPESEMDVEGLGSDVKLEFESSTEEVTTT